MFTRFRTKKKFLAYVTIFLVSILLEAATLWGINMYSSLVIDLSGGAKKATYEKERAKAIRDLSSETLEDQKKISSYIVSSANVVSFLESIEQLGKVAGVQMEIDSVGSVVPKGDQSKLWERLRLIVSAEGSWSGNLNILYLLETIPFQVTTERVVLDQKKDEKKNSWHSEITFSVLKEK